LVEGADRVGGLCLVNPFQDEWNASLPGMTGMQVADNLARSVEQAEVPVYLSHRAMTIDSGTQGFSVKCRDSAAVSTLKARYVVIATGVKARGLDSEGDKAAAANVAPGVLIGPGAHIVAQQFDSRRIAVLGGGDNAFENALYAQERGASTVDVYARTLRAQRQFVRRFPPANILLGDYQVDVGARCVNGRQYDLILVFYGWEPCVRFADALELRRTDRGFVATGPHTAETSFPGVYAIGEVAQRQHPCVVTALADGVTAAKAIQARIERAPIRAGRAKAASGSHGLIGPFEHTLGRGGGTQLDQI
jgi:thioredoxin reductase